MQTTKWNKKRLFFILFGLIISYIFFSTSYNEYQIDGIIKNVRPEIVWEFVADFSKMRLLNPTIIDTKFNIIADHGNLHHWKYTVLYKEKLSHWPYWINDSKANYAVKKIEENSQNKYTIESDHETCFFGGLYCLHSKGEFEFVAKQMDTHCIERVYYQCPPFMGQFCRREVEYQRRAIMKNLVLQFQKTN